MDNKVKLLSSENELFEVEVWMVQECETLKYMMEVVDSMDRDRDRDTISLPICSKVLAKVIEYCQHHAESRASSDGKPAVAQDKVKEWDDSFIQMDYHTLAEAASFLEIRALVSLAGNAVAEMIMNKGVKQINRIFKRNKFGY